VAMEERDLLDCSVAVPKNVVYREFAHETVILNLDTGKYHGINRTAARMLDVLQQSPTIRAAAESLAEEYGQPVDRIETDLVAFCAGLLERELIAVVERGDG
jgi:Coenzyme PQQ synthesis protein D (PqqD)